MDQLSFLAALFLEEDFCFGATLAPDLRASLDAMATAGLAFPLAEVFLDDALFFAAMIPPTGSMTS
jgi:hypothetical protein